jgi:hypothetical protein
VAPPLALMRIEMSVGASEGFQVAKRVDPGNKCRGDV